MKTLLITCICSIALAAGAWAQGPSISPIASPGSTIPAAASPSVSPTASASATASDMADRLHNRIEKKLKEKGVHITIGGDDADKEANKSDDSVHVKTGHGGDDIPELVLPIVAIAMFTIFGAPVLMVGLIMYF